MFGRKIVKSEPTGTTATSESPLSREIRGILAQSAGQHPLDVAARLTALCSTQDYDDNRVEFIRIRDIDHPCVCDLSRMDGNPVGISFSFSGAAGETGLIYLTTEFSQLSQRGVQAGPRIPADMITPYVKDYVDAVKALVVQLSPRRSPEELAQEQRIKSQLKQFLG